LKEGLHRPDKLSAHIPFDRFSALSFCLLSFHSEFGVFLRQELEKKLVELEEEGKARQQK